MSKKFITCRVYSAKEQRTENILSVKYYAILRGERITLTLQEALRFKSAGVEVHRVIYQDTII